MAAIPCSCSKPSPEIFDRSPIERSIPDTATYRSACISVLQVSNLQAMSIILSLFRNLERFEEWFDDRFGWFFTNGMKEQERYDPSIKV